MTTKQILGHDWSKRDWFFCVILAVVTILAYQPSWHGGLLWDDDANIGGPELRTLDGLRRMWFAPRTTQQYYPLLHTSYWLQQRLCTGDAKLKINEMGSGYLLTCWHICLEKYVTRRDHQLRSTKEVD